MRLESAERAIWPTLTPRHRTRLCDLSQSSPYTVMHLSPVQEVGKSMMVAAVTLCLLIQAITGQLGGVSGLEAWSSNVDVIRIQNNGSQIRTIYLPKLTSFKITENSISNESHKTNVPPDNLILIGQSKGNVQEQKGTIFNTKRTHDKSQKVNLSQVNLTQTTSLRTKKDPSQNRTLLPASHGVGIRIGAEKIGKLLNLFTIVNFTNEPCFTAEGIVGVCYHPTECHAIAGTVQGPCAQGFGVCCYVERSCGQSSAVNNTYVTATEMALDSQAGVYICTIVIDKTTSDVKQLRLSFLSFELVGPVDGNCNVDRFVVTGQNQNNIIPALCGSNTGSHVYVDVNEVDGPLSLTILSSGAHGLGAPRGLKILVTQLRHGDALLAPRNCLQYYTGLRGSLQSFNYVPHNTTAPLSMPGYFNNLNYAVCFKKESGYCGIKYSNVATSGMEYTFELVNVENDGTGTVPVGQAGAEGFDCPDDYISISGLRLCGYKLNDGSTLVDYSKNYPVSDTTNGPLMLQFHTNNNVTGRGFYLDYMLTPCAASALPGVSSAVSVPSLLPSSAVPRAAPHT